PCSSLRPSLPWPPEPLLWPAALPPPAGPRAPQKFRLRLALEPPLPGRARHLPGRFSLPPGPGPNLPPWHNDRRHNRRSTNRSPNSREQDTPRTLPSNKDDDDTNHSSPTPMNIGMDAPPVPPRAYTNKDHTRKQTPAHAPHKPGDKQ